MKFIPSHQISPHTGARSCFASTTSHRSGHPLAQWPAIALGGPGPSRNGTIVGYTSRGAPVFNRPHSHSHVPAELLTEALSRIAPATYSFAKFVIAMGREVGSSSCVPTTASDTITFARRERRHGLTRFVKGLLPISCSNMVVILMPTGDGNSWVLITAFIGDGCEPEPWDRNATLESRDYWNGHALIWGSEAVLPGTETARCPW